MVARVRDGRAGDWKGVVSRIKDVGLVYTIGVVGI